MACRIAGGIAVCGPTGRKEEFYFCKDQRYVLQCDSMWYEPRVRARRKKYERIDYFRRRVKKKLGFMPWAFSTWWRRVARPYLQQL